MDTQALIIRCVSTYKLNHTGITAYLSALDQGGTRLKGSFGGFARFTIAINH